MSAPMEGAPSQSQSKGRLVMVALALSLALNVFFVGGLVYGKFMRPGPGGPLVALDGNSTSLRSNAEHFEISFK